MIKKLIFNIGNNLDRNGKKEIDFISKLNWLNLLDDSNLNEFENSNGYEVIKWLCFKVRFDFESKLLESQTVRINYFRIRELKFLI